MRFKTKERDFKMEKTAAMAWRRLLAQNEKVQKIKEASATNKRNKKGDKQMENEMKVMFRVSMKG